jgi:hypothetical protein
LKSADRETNNPGAQAEMNPEELLLYLARDPEQARAAIEQQKKMMEEETRQRVRRQAWTSLRGIATRAQSLARIPDEAQRAQIHREMDELRGYLAQVPAATWPWFFLADLAQNGVPMLFGPDWVLYQGGALFREGTGLEIGEVRGDAVGIRMFKDHRWDAVTVEKLTSSEPRYPFDVIQKLLAVATPEDYRAAYVHWPLAEDREAFEPALRKAIGELRGGDFEGLGLGQASAAWRTWLWNTYRDAIVETLTRAPNWMPFRIPVGKRSPGTALSLQLLTGPELQGRFEDVLPFLSEEFSRFVELAPSSGQKWSELNATALAWWGRAFPRGLLREADPGTLIEIKTREGTHRVRAVWQSAHFAVTYSQGRGPDHPDGPLFNVTHIPSGMAAAQSFLSADAARIAAQFLASLQTNWESDRPDTARLPRNLSSVLAWIRAQKEAPTMADVAKKAAE